MDVSKLPKLDKWCITYDNCLVGIIFNDSRFPDGHCIRTSKLKRIDFELGYAVTKNTVYNLGSQEREDGY
jgi:hypothetical protein